MRLYGENAITRRTALRGLASLSTMAACGWPATAFSQTVQKFTYVLPYDVVMYFAPILNALAGDYFKRSNLDGNLAAFRGTAQAVQQLIAGNAEFGEIGFIDFLKAYARQPIPVVSVGTFPQGGIFFVTSLKDRPINGPTDMVGKVIGISSVGGGTENFLDLMLVRAGINPKTIERQAVGQNPGNIAHLRSGRIACFISTIEVVIPLERAGEPITVFPVSKFAPLPGGIVAATRQTVERRPDLVVSFLRAYNLAVQDFLKADEGEIVDRITKRFDLTGDKDRTNQMAAVKALKDAILARGADKVLLNDPKVWDDGARLMAEAGLGDITKDVRSMYTNDLLQKAVG